MIEIYPTANTVINLENGGSVSGRLASLFPNFDHAGVLLLKNPSGAITGAVSLCRIAFITIPSVTYDNSIEYLGTPSPLPNTCDIDCEQAIRQGLPVGTEHVNIRAGGSSTGNGTVIKNEFGIIVLAGSNNISPTFVNICEIEEVEGFVP